VNGELKRLRDVERWIGGIRLAAVPFAIFQVAIASGYPSGYRVWAWVTTGVFTVGALALFWLSRRDWPRTTQSRLGLVALAFDFAVVSAYVLIFSFEDASPVRQLMYLPLVEAALRYGIWGAVVFVAASAPVLAVFESLREHRSDPRTYHLDYVTLQLGIELLMGLFVGWLVGRLRSETAVAEERAGEAERLRDQLARRADTLEAANRCARALSSSLVLEQAFDAFIREVRGLLPFDRGHSPAEWRAIRLRLREVCGDEVGMHTLCATRGDGFITLRAARATMNQHVRPGRRVRFGDGAADALGRAGDQRCMSLQTDHERAPLSPNNHASGARLAMSSRTFGGSACSAAVSCLYE